MLKEHTLSRRDFLEAAFAGGITVFLTACAEQDNHPITSDELDTYLNPLVDHLKTGDLLPGVSVKRDPKMSDITTTYTKGTNTITIKSNYYETTSVRLESTTNGKKTTFEYLKRDQRKNVWNISTTQPNKNGDDVSTFNTTSDLYPLRAPEFEGMKRKGKDIIRSFIP